VPRYRRRLTVGTTPTRTAGRIGQLVSSQLAGLALAALMVRQGAARSRSRRAYCD